MTHTGATHSRMHGLCVEGAACWAAYYSALGPWVEWRLWWAGPVAGHEQVPSPDSVLDSECAYVRGRQH